MKRRDVLIGGAASLAAGLARPAVAQGAKILKYLPQADLANPDPIWTTPPSRPCTATWCGTRCTASTKG